MKWAHHWAQWFSKDGVFIANPSEELQVNLHNRESSKPKMEHGIRDLSSCET
jgi:hypothetical protein